MKIELLTINYNTPELVAQLFFTVFNFCSYKLDCTVINNGPVKFTDNLANVNIIDFEREAREFIDNCRKTNKLQLRESKSLYGSVHHAYTIDSYVYDKSAADYILLFDTDIIVKENFDTKVKFLIDSDQPLYSCRTDEDISGTPCSRIAPHCCFINRKRFIEMGLRFLTADKFLDITHTNSYDTGRGLLENVSGMNLRFFEDNSFFQHLKGISWKKME